MAKTDFICQSLIETTMKVKQVSRVQKQMLHLLTTNTLKHKVCKISDFDVQIKLGNEIVQPVN